MRSFRLLLVVFLVVLVSGTAASQDVKTGNESASAPHSYMRPFAAPKNFGARGSRNFSSDRWFGQSAEYADTICLTMHRLRVAQDDGTDATHLVGQSTCTPAKRFQMKSAVVTESQK